MHCDGSRRQHGSLVLAIFREKILLFSQPGAVPENALEEIIGQVRGLDMDDVRVKVAEAQAEAEAKG